jgi:transposase
VDALRRHPAPGQRAKLTNEQFAQLPLLLSRGAESFGFRGDKWTTRRVAAVIQQIFGVSYHPGHVSRLLQQHFPGWRDTKKTLAHIRQDTFDGRRKQRRYDNQQ